MIALRSSRDRLDIGYYVFAAAALAQEFALKTGALLYLKEVVAGDFAGNLSADKRSTLFSKGMSEFTKSALSQTYKLI